MLDNRAAPPSPRQHWMAVLARSTRAELEQLLAACPALPAYTVLRAAEAGTVMVQGRAGGDGAAFNLGEMTVSRCSVRTSAGHVGHAYVAGRDTGLAELAAVLDAALADPDTAPALQQRVVAPLSARQQAARDSTARKAAATQVQFFTLATMRA